MIPIICSASVPLYLYLSSPEHVLMKGYKEIRKLENLKIENEDWDILKEELCNVPPDVQTAVIAGHSAVLLSTIPNLKQGTIIDDKEMFSFLRETSRNYFYQVVTPQFSQKTDLLIISRMPRENQHRKRKMTWFLIPVSICIGVFEVFCIIAIIAISRTISHSIFILEKDTEKIASGDLDFDLEADSEKNHHTSNEITSLRQKLFSPPTAIEFHKIDEFVNHRLQLLRFAPNHRKRFFHLFRLRNNAVGNRFGVSPDKRDRSP